MWDWWLREYHQRRVFVDIDVERVTEWPDLAARGQRETRGPDWPAPAGGQKPPRKGTGPRAEVRTLARQLDGLPHRLLAYAGADGFPVIAPVAITGHDATGLHLDAAPGLLPTGGRRAGLLAHTFRPRLVGLGMRTLTGWLATGGKGAVYAPTPPRG